MSNFFMAAALSGLGAGVNAAGRAAAADEESRQRMADRIALLQAEAQARGVPRSGGGGGASVPTPFNRAEYESKVEALTGMAPGELAKVRDGSLWEKAEYITSDDEGNPLEQPQEVYKGKAQGWEALRAKKLAELQPQLESVMFGKDYDKVAEGMGERQRQRLIDDYASKKDDRAGQAALLSQGKDVYGGNSDVTRNAVSGETKTTPVGDASAKKKLEEAGKADDQGRAALVKASQPPRSGGSSSGGKASDPDAKALKELTQERILLNQRVTALKAALDTGVKTVDIGGKPVPTQQAYQSALSKLLALEKQASAAPAATPAPASAPASAPSGFKIINVRQK